MASSILLLCIALANVAFAEDRSLLFASSSKLSPPSPPCPESIGECSTEPVAFPVPDLAEKNEVFDQLTVAEQLTIQEYMAGLGVTITGPKCRTVNCSTIAKVQLVYPPKSEVLAYLDGTGPKPKRIAQFWWLRANLRPRVAQLHQIEMPITESSTPTLIREVPWESRPFVTWEGVHSSRRSAAVAPMMVLFDDILKDVVISDRLKEAYPNNFDGNETTGAQYPQARISGGAHSLPGSTPGRRIYLGSSQVRGAPGNNYFKEGPLTFKFSYDWDTDDIEVFDITWCPGVGNPVFGSVEEIMAAYEAGTLIMCTVDGEWYGDSLATFDAIPPYFIPEDAMAKAEPRIYYPDGPRFSVVGRTVSWMGWDLHTDINGLTGLHIMNLRFQGQRIVYELHATDFTAVYGGHSNKKDLFYSDGGYEMGNCATTLKVGLQCPEQSVFLPSLGYDSGYVWGGDLTPEAVNEYATCVFEAPDNEALYQHAHQTTGPKMHEGNPKSALFIRTVLTVGNYDYTQTLKLYPDGEFDFFKQLSGYAVGAYVPPGIASTEALSDIWGSLVSHSSLGALHTHSAGYKIDLDIMGLENSFKIKNPFFGPIADTLTEVGIDPATVAYINPNSYGYTTTPVTSEGVWDDDGDEVWTPPDSCFKAEPRSKYIIYNNDVKTRVGHTPGYAIFLPLSPPQLLPEGDPYLHLQNFTKCDLAVTKQSDGDIEAVGMEIFGNLQPNSAAEGHDISDFFNGESLEQEDLVLYAHSTKMHFVTTNDVPVPSTMGKEISFFPYNYFLDDLSPIKHIPEYKQEVTKCAA